MKSIASYIFCFFSIFSLWSQGAYAQSDMHRGLISSTVELAKPALPFDFRPLLLVDDMNFVEGELSYSAILSDSLYADLTSKPYDQAKVDFFDFQFHLNPNAIERDKYAFLKQCYLADAYYTWYLRDEHGNTFTLRYSLDDQLAMIEGRPVSATMEAFTPPAEKNEGVVQEPFLAADLPYTFLPFDPTTCSSNGLLALLIRTLEGCPTGILMDHQQELLDVFNSEDCTKLSQFQYLEMEREVDALGKIYFWLSVLSYQYKLLDIDTGGRMSLIGIDGYASEIEKNYGSASPLRNAARIIQYFNNLNSICLTNWNKENQDIDYLVQISEGDIYKSLCFRLMKFYLLARQNNLDAFLTVRDDYKKEVLSYTTKKNRVNAEVFRHFVKTFLQCTSSIATPPKELDTWRFLEADGSLERYRVVDEWLADLFVEMTKVMYAPSEAEYVEAFSFLAERMATTYYDYLGAIELLQPLAANKKVAKDVVAGIRQTIGKYQEEYNTIFEGSLDDISTYQKGYFSYERLRRRLLSEGHTALSYADSLLYQSTRYALDHSSELHNDVFVGNAYRNVAYAKGLYFNNRSLAFDILANVSSTTAEKVRVEYLYTMQKLSRRDISTEKRDSLAQRLSAVELAAIRVANRYVDTSEKLSQLDAAISRYMTMGDVLIDFSCYLDQGTKRYGAFVYGKNTRTTFIPLFEEGEVKRTEACYMNPELSKLIWEPLLPFMKSGKKVYFSPIGELNVISIENLPHPIYPNRLIGEEYCLLRISSLAKINAVTNTGLNNAVCFGDIEYGPASDEVLTSSSTRGASNIALPATAIEIETISQLMKEEQWHTELRTGYKANEQSVKELSGKPIDVLHFATHGFFIDNDKHLESDQLSLSGLLFADSEDGTTDNNGLLDANEISCLDFSKTDLVVMSACETGLGNITNDGVFGLQRGFKKAGANSILMSLWKVDDEATCKLMTEFYSNWITHKMTKHDALEAAKKTVRETPGWEDPKYWAAFILLDGLD